MKIIVQLLTYYIIIFQSAFATAQNNVTESGSNTEKRWLIQSLLSSYEPIYFLAGTNPVDAKFQISFKFGFINPDSNTGKRRPWLTGFQFGYTQTSLWDLTSHSNPFKNTSFKPEIFYEFKPVPINEDSKLNFQFGLFHESNGKNGFDSRSLNTVFKKITFVKNLQNDFFISATGTINTYFGITDNPDIKDYRGLASLKTTAGYKDGLQITTYIHGNLSTGNGSLTIDASYPLSHILNNNLNFYLHAQLFTGYGETLLNYYVEDTNFRIGISLYR